MPPGYNKNLYEGNIPQNEATDRLIYSVIAEDKAIKHARRARWAARLSLFPTAALFTLASGTLVVAGLGFGGLAAITQDPNVVNAGNELLGISRDLWIATGLSTGVNILAFRRSSRLKKEKDRLRQSAYDQSDAIDDPYHPIAAATLERHGARQEKFEDMEKGAVVGAVATPVLHAIHLKTLGISAIVALLFGTRKGRQERMMRILAKARAQQALNEKQELEKQEKKAKRKRK